MTQGGQMHKGDGNGDTVQSQQWLNFDESNFEGRIERLIQIGDAQELEEAVRSSDAGFQAIVEDQTELIMRFLANGTLTFVNHAAYRYLGKKRGELIGHSFFSFILNEDREMLIKHLTSLEPYNPTGVFESRVILPTGEVRWMQWTNRAICDSEGGLIEYQSIGHDINELKMLHIQTEQMLSEITRQSDSLRNLIENMPVGIALLDSDFNVVYANDAFVVYFEKSGNQTSSTRIDNLLPGAEKCGIMAAAEQALRKHQAVRLHDVLYVGIDGNEFYWSGSIVPVRLQSGDNIVSGIAMIMVDMTAEMNTRKRLAELASLAERRAADIETQRRRLKTIIQSTPVALVVCDTEWRIISYNDAALCLSAALGIISKSNKDWFSGLEIFDANHQRIELADSPMGRSLLGESCNEEIIHYRIGRSASRTLSVNSAPLRNMDGEINGVVAAFTDITEQLQAQKRIQDLYQREHVIAEKLQGCFLPREFSKIPGFEISQIYQTALDEALIGGDFYDIFDLGEGEYGVVIADVAGKGLNAAVYTSMTKYMLRAYALSEKSPELVLAKLNEALTSCTPVEIFVTLVYGILDTKSKKFTYANAGHEQPFYHKRKKQTLETLESTGRALALLSGSSYEVRTIDLCPDDVLLFYTDGITDAGSGANRFEHERALAVMESNRSCSADELAESMLAAALDFAGGKFRDDAAVLVIRRLDE